MTFGSGQIFRWKKEGSWWTGWLRGSRISLTKEGDLISYRSNPILSPEIVRNFLGLELSSEEILRSLPDDEFTQEIARRYLGLRVLRQDPWECLVSYILSASMNITNINRMLDRLVAIVSSSESLGSFPSPTRVLDVSKLDVNFLGKKWSYIVCLARLITTAEIDLEELKKNTYTLAWNRLVRDKPHPKGIGPKIADCALLFSMDKYEAFPIDRWVLRGLLFYYPKIVKNAGLDYQIRETLTRSQYSILSNYLRNYFGSYCGCFQEYLFFHSRINLSRKGP